MMRESSDEADTLLVLSRIETDGDFFSHFIRIFRVRDLLAFSLRLFSTTTDLSMLPNAVSAGGDLEAEGNPFYHIVIYFLIYTVSLYKIQWSVCNLKTS